MQSSLRAIALAIWATTLAPIDAPAAEQSGDGTLKRVGQFALHDTQGREHDERALSKPRATVFVFLGIECPVSNGYAPELTRLAREFRPRGVEWLGVQSDPDVSAEQAARHARDYGLDFPVLMDPRQTLAPMAGATMVPEVAVVRSDGAVVYRGRVDDRYTTDGKRRPVPTKHDLRESLEAVLKGERPAIAETRAFGCPLPRLLKSIDANGDAR